MRRGGGARETAQEHTCLTSTRTKVQICNSHIKNWLYVCNPSMVRKEHADAWSLLNDQFSPVVELWVQRETLSQKIRWKAIEEDRHQHLVSI